jgi:hypothetical protein
MSEESKLDQTEEHMDTDEVSDEALEQAAGMMGGAISNPCDQTGLLTYITCCR